MALICDTSGLFALYDTSNVDHEATAAVVEGEPGDCCWCLSCSCVHGRRA